MPNHRLVLILLLMWAAQALADRPTPTIVPIDKTEAASRVVVRAPGEGQWKVTKKDTNGAYSLSEGSREPGEGVPAHTHSVRMKPSTFWKANLRFTLRTMKRSSHPPALSCSRPKDYVIFSRTRERLEPASW